eukprot:1370625-Amorphochlora_amoeboformis.AAC.1
MGLISPICQFPFRVPRMVSLGHLIERKLGQSLRIGLMTLLLEDVSHDYSKNKCRFDGLVKGIERKWLTGGFVRVVWGGGTLCLASVAGYASSIMGTMAVSIMG